MSAGQRFFLTAMIVSAAVGFAYRGFHSTVVTQLDQSTFYDALTRGRVKEVTLVPDQVGFEIRGTLTPEHPNPDDAAEERFTTYVMADGALAGLLREKGVAAKAESPRGGTLPSILVPWILLLLAGAAFFFFFLRPMYRQGGGLFLLTRSQAKLSPRKGAVGFDDVAGVAEAKQELQEIVEFLKEPAKFQALGGKIPRGVLLTGAPGTGKTLLARAVAGEAGVPFYSVSGSDFVEMFVGIGASRVRDLFKQGKSNAPCIVFIDEIDAVGRQRGSGMGSGHDEREQTLNQLLVELDGFDTSDGVIVLAATNRPDVLDSALLRPGRFDRQIAIDPPDLRGREEILKIHARKVPLDVDVELGVIARGSSGFSGADLANLVNEAALRAARLGQETVTGADFEYAKDKGLMGGERRSLIIGEVERRAIAYRQAGHALLAHLLPGADPLHKVTIVPRGRALGTTQQIPAGDRHTVSRRYLRATICGLMGGRVAEEMQLDLKSSAVGADFERATTLARKMVKEWGMSEKLGPLAYGKPAEPIFLGRELARRRHYSEATAAEIDREIKGIVTGGYDKARRILEKRRELLDRIAEALLRHETLSADQIKRLVRGELLPWTPRTAPDGREPECVERKQTVAMGLKLLPKPGLWPA